MDTTKATGKALAQTVKNISPCQSEVAEIEHWLKANGQQFPNEFAMKALYEFITTGEPFSMADQFAKFIDDLRMVFLSPEVSKAFFEVSSFTGIGLHQYLKSLEDFLRAMQCPQAKAEIDRFGLLEYHSRYTEDQEWGGVEGVMRDYRAAK